MRVGWGLRVLGCVLVGVGSVMGAQVCPSELGTKTRVGFVFADKWAYVPLRGCAEGAGGAACASWTVSVEVGSVEGSTGEAASATEAPSVEWIVTDAQGVRDVEGGASPGSVARYSSLEAWGRRCAGVQSRRVPAGAPATLFALVRCVPARASDVGCRAEVGVTYAAPCAACGAPASPGLMSARRVVAFVHEGVGDVEGVEEEEEGGVGGYGRELESSADDDAGATDDATKFQTCVDDATAAMPTGWQAMSVSQGAWGVFSVPGCDVSGCRVLTWSVHSAVGEPRYTALLVNATNRDRALANDWAHIEALQGANRVRCNYEPGYAFAPNSADATMYVVVNCEGRTQGCSSLQYNFAATIPPSSSPIPSPSPEASATPSQTPLPSIAPSASQTPAPVSASASPSASASTTTTAQASTSSTPSLSATPSVSPTNSPTPSTTRSATPTPSPTPSTSPSTSPSPSQSPTVTASATVTATATSTPSGTPSVSLTPSVTPTVSLTPSVTPSNSATPSNLPTSTRSATPTPSRTPSRSPGASPTTSPTPSPSASSAPTAAACVAAVQLVPDPVTLSVPAGGWANMTLWGCGAAPEGACTSVRFGVAAADPTSLVSVYVVDSANRARAEAGLTFSFDTTLSVERSLCAFQTGGTTQRAAGDTVHVMVFCEKGASAGPCLVHGGLEYVRPPAAVAASAGRLPVLGGVGNVPLTPSSCALAPEDVSAVPQFALVAAGKYLFVPLTGCAMGPQGCHDVTFAVRSTGYSVSPVLADDDATSSSARQVVSVFGVNAGGKASLAAGGKPPFATTWYFRSKPCFGGSTTSHLSVPASAGDAWFVAIGCDAPPASVTDDGLGGGIAGVDTGHVCGVEYAVTYSRPVPSYAGASAANKPVVSNSPLPRASALPAPSADDGAPCAANMDCKSLRCRGGRCCNARVPQACALCSADQGICSGYAGAALATLPATGGCPAACSDPDGLLATACGDTSSPAFQCIDSSAGPWGSGAGSRGQCLCDGQVVAWRGVGFGAQCASIGLVACAEAVAFHNNDSALLQAAFAGGSGAGADARPRGASSVWAIVIVALIFFSFFVCAAYYYVQRYQPEWAMSMGLIPVPQDPVPPSKARSASLSVDSASPSSSPVQSPLGVASRSPSSRSLLHAGSIRAADVELADVARTTPLVVAAKPRLDPNPVHHALRAAPTAPSAPTPSSSAGRARGRGRGRGV